MKEEVNATLTTVELIATNKTEPSDKRYEYSNSSLTFFGSESSNEFITERHNYRNLIDAEPSLELDQIVTSDISLNDLMETLSESLNLNNLTKQKSFVNRCEAVYNVSNNKINTSIDIDKKVASKSRNAVSFSTLEVRYYPIILGDNPESGATNGAPISISWEYFDVMTIPIDCYELYRKPQKTRCQLIKTPYSRKQLLMRIGFSESSIDKRILEMKIIRKQRFRSYRNAILYDYFCKKLFIWKRSNICCVTNKSSIG